MDGHTGFGEKKYGVSRVIDHFKQIEVNPDIKSARQYLMSTCEGVDCWYDPEEDEHIENHTAKNCFCKLEIVPFPFTCTLLYDNGKQTLYDGKSILKLASQNKSSLCAIRKETRLTLRAMANSMNIKIHFPYKEGRFEPVEIRKGKIQDIDMDLEFEEGSLIIQAVDGSPDVFPSQVFRCL